MSLDDFFPGSASQYKACAFQRSAFAKSAIAGLAYSMLKNAAVIVVQIASVLNDMTILHTRCTLRGWGDLYSFVSRLVSSSVANVGWIFALTEILGY